MVIGSGSTAILLFDSSSGLATTWDHYFIPFNSTIYFISGALITLRPHWFTRAILLSALPSMLYQQGVFFWSIQFPDPVSYYSTASAGGFFPMLYVVLFIALPRQAKMLSTLHCFVLYLQFAIHSFWLTNTSTPDARAAAEAIFVAVLISHPIYVISLSYITKLHHKIRAAHAQGIRQKADFLAMLSHELKNMLQTLMSTVETLQLRLRSSSEQKILERIDLATEQLQFCLRDAAEMAHLEHPELSIRNTHFELVELLADIDKQWRPVIEQKGLAFSITPPPAPLSLHADRKRLSQILDNLLGNALKYTLSGSIELLYSFQDKQYLSITVKDTGIGIPEEQQENIFKPYVRLRQPLVAQASGSGLGLSMVKTLSERLNGQINVSSTPGSGSSFTVKFPIDADLARKYSA